MYAVILAGGKGKRFWPASSSRKPKQFLSIAGSRSMLSLTFDRLSAFIPDEKIILITVEEQASLARKELPDLPDENLLIEPSGRNTAPALALAALVVAARSEDEPMLACPADHLIKEEDNFRLLAGKAGEFASENDALITFGIEPEYPATGYGYIESGDEISPGGGILEAKQFHEKPERELAQRYIDDGNFYWNSGIFVWRPSVFLKAWEDHIPSGSGPLSRISSSIGKPEMEKAVRESYPKLPSISVDYGILEKAVNVAVIPGELGWNDVGSWDALYHIHRADGNENVSIGDSEVLDSSGCVFFNPQGFTAAIGVDDIIVISHGGTVLVCRRGDSQKVREMVELISEKGYNELL